MKIAPGERPPNYSAIIQAIPVAAKPGVCFTYGETVYIPDGYSKLTPSLIVHEKTHISQQGYYGAKEWWEQYLEDTEFRFEQELEAHRVEYSWFRRYRPLKAKKALKVIAERLSSDLYGCVETKEECMRMIIEQGGTGSGDGHLWPSGGG